MEDSGEYSIHASNELGSDVAEIKLNVKYPPKIAKPGNLECMANEQFKMSIDIEGNPMPTAKFYKNGQELVETERIKLTVADNYFLIKFNNTVLEDTGTYSVSLKAFNTFKNKKMKKEFGFESEISSWIKNMWGWYGWYRS